MLYLVPYLLGLLGYHKIMRVQCNAGIPLIWGRGEFGQFSKLQGGRVEEFSGSIGMRIYGGLVNFHDHGGMAYVGQ